MYKNNSMYLIIRKIKKIKTITIIKKVIQELYILYIKLYSVYLIDQFLVCKKEIKRAIEVNVLFPIVTNTTNRSESNLIKRKS